MNATKKTCAEKRKREESDNSSKIPGAFTKRKEQDSVVTTSSRTFDALDVDCLAHIFSFLAWKDGFSMRQVSKKCKLAMEYTWSRVKVFESNNESIDLHGKHADDDRERYFLLFCAKYLRRYEKKKNFPTTHKCFEVLRRDCRNLTFIDVSVILQHKHYLFDAFTNMQQLKTIKIRLLPLKSEEDSKEDLHDTMILDSVTRNVQEITLEGYQYSIHLGKQFARIFEKFKSLTRLEFIRWTFESSVMRVISQKITLRDLAFISCHFETINELVLSNFTNLESLNFNCSIMSSQQDSYRLSRNIAIHQQNLVFLDIAGLEVNYETLLLFTKFRNLKKFNLSIVEETDEYILSQIKNLTKFSCFRGKVMNDSIIKDFMERNKNLEYLNITRTSVTSETVHFLYNLTKARKHNAAVLRLAVHSELFEEVQDFLKLNGDNPYFSIEICSRKEIAIRPKYPLRLRTRSKSVGTDSNESTCNIEFNGYGMLPYDIDA